MGKKLVTENQINPGLTHESNSKTLLSEMEKKNSIYYQIKVSRSLHDYHFHSVLKPIVNIQIADTDSVLEKAVAHSTGFYTEVAMCSISLLR